MDICWNFNTDRYFMPTTIPRGCENDEYSTTFNSVRPWDRDNDDG